mgnify:CR=1 FL=1
MNYEDLFKILLSGLLLFGTFFIVIGAFGLVKLDDFFRRLHAPTKASTLGVGCILAASVGYHLVLGEDPQPRELLITVFLFITAPVSAHLMAKAALSLMLEKRPAPPVADPNQDQCTLPGPDPAQFDRDHC